MTNSMLPDLSSTDVEILTAAHTATERLIRAALVLNGGPLPPVGSQAWLTASWPVQAAGLALYGCAWLAHDLEAEIARRLKAMSVDLSWAHDWAAASRRPSHAELQRRRAEPGPAHAPFDPVIADRWVETGSSAETAA